jgi:hyaluronan synthase
MTHIPTHVPKHIDSLFISGKKYVYARVGYEIWIMKLRRVIIWALALVVISLIVLVKDINLVNKGIIVIFYTLIITVFEVSRVSASMMYKDYITPSNVEYEPNVTFIIPCKNEEKVIAKTITKCFEVEYPKNKIEVVVINDGSTDNTWKEIERIKLVYPNLKAVNWSVNKGKREGMAEGFHQATGEIVIQLDSDSYIEKTSFRRLLQPFIDPQIAGVCAHTDPENKDENFLTKMQTAYYFMSFRALKAAESVFEMVFCCSGCCSAYRKSVVTSEILDDWKNETFMKKKIPWGDDRALTNLILKLGFKTVYAYNVQAYTVVPNNFRTFLKQQTRWKKGWFVNTYNVLKYVWKRDKFVALTYSFPLFLITLITPFIAFRALVINPLIYGISPVFYIIGIFLISLIMVLHYNYFRKDGYWKYMFLWSVLNLTCLSYIMIYALLDMKNTKWGTR